MSESRLMEMTWYGRTCVRLRGKDAVVVADPYQSVVGPTGRGITGDIVTFSHPDDAPVARGKPKGKLSRDGSTLIPSSLDAAFVLDGPGEYEVKEVLVTGVRTYRDDAKGAEHGKGVSFVVEVDGVHTIHLGEIGHLLSEEKLGDIGPVDIACVPARRGPQSDQGRGTDGPARPEDRRADAAVRGRRRLRRGARQVLPRDGRRARHAAEAVGHRVEPARPRR